ncbi:DUF6817 domain-containing protein [Streptomyces xinghaiensis]|uniref:DUF6817 domain-containing protein n=1 Tax=Streptomyces xinghaiensis TaxID=1038928 RepID=UPI0002E59810|nr:hypothetical protein [Streptomyces xinghaiensis]
MPVLSGATHAMTLLRALGAGEIEHPGGSLLEHVRRVGELLGDWDARPALRLAGLCHALYGTDGFPSALLPLARRPQLAAAIGAEAEALVYFYASCDRKVSYPALLDDPPLFRDRFSGRVLHPGPQRLRDFAELTAANELDIARVSPEFRRQRGVELRALLTSLRPLLSEAAWAECRAVLF